MENICLQSNSSASISILSGNWKNKTKQDNPITSNHRLVFHDQFHQLTEGIPQQPLANHLANTLFGLKACKTGALEINFTATGVNLQQSPTNQSENTHFPQ